MADREKLVELIQKTFDEQYAKRGLLTAYHTAEYLIENDVTVKKPQKPLTVENLIFFDWEIWREWWIELKSGRLFCVKECRGYIHTPKDEYGKTWRCWKEKPTEEERQDSEWL